MATHNFSWIVNGLLQPSCSVVYVFVPACVTLKQKVHDGTVSVFMSNGTSRSDGNSQDCGFLRFSRLPGLPTDLFSDALHQPATATSISVTGV